MESEDLAEALCYEDGEIWAVLEPEQRERYRRLAQRAVDLFENSRGAYEFGYEAGYSEGYQEGRAAQKKPEPVGR